jgi:hypothetical protein
MVRDLQNQRTSSTALAVFLKSGVFSVARHLLDLFRRTASKVGVASRRLPSPKFSSG